jgi:V/A-type H+-transporting ATPase subunit D
MSRMAVPSTKSQLLRLRADLVFLHAGRELMDQKREFLSEALLTFWREARALRERVEERLAAAYALLAEAHAAHGAVGLERLALAAEPLARLDVRERSLMGVVVPVLRVPDTEAGPPGSLGAATGAAGLSADGAASELRALLPRLAELGEIESSCLRLARALASVRRKLNALEVVHIPAHRETIGFIADQLEEREREQLFQLKRVRELEEDTR